MRWQQLLQRRQQPRKVETPVDCSWVSNEKMDYACGSYEDEFGPLCLCEADTLVPLSRPARHTREVRFFKPDFFCVQDFLDSLDGKEHSYELRWQLDTVKMEHFSPIPGAWLSDCGATWDILIVPLFSEKLTSRTLCGVDTPPMGGWFVGRNDKHLHKSTTLTMTLSGDRNGRFATLLIPVCREQEMPRLKRIGEEVFQLTFKGVEHRIDLANLKAEQERPQSLQLTNPLR